MRDGRKPLTAVALLRRQRRKRIRPLTLGADKGYCTGSGSLSAREQDPPAHCPHRASTHAGSRWLEPHDMRVTGSVQRHRKRIEEIFGWLKTSPA